MKIRIIKEDKQKKMNLGQALSNSFMDGLQAAASVFGLLPIAGDKVDLANASLSFARGNNLDGYLNLISAFPVIGDAFGKGVKAVIEMQRMGLTVITIGTKTYDINGLAGSLLDFYKNKREYLKKLSPDQIPKIANRQKMNGDYLVTELDRLLIPKLQDIAQRKTSSKPAADGLTPQFAVD